jgi:hypothetical protein
MIATLNRPLIILFICAFYLTTTKAANAGIAGASDGKSAGVVIALVGVGVLIGVGVYFAVHHGHSIKGCASSGAGGMQILNESDQRTYELAGDLDGIKAGNRVRISGNEKKLSDNTRHRDQTIEGLRAMQNPGFNILKSRDRSIAQSALSVPLSPRLSG